MTRGIYGLVYTLSIITFFEYSLDNIVLSCSYVDILPSCILKSLFVSVTFTLSYNAFLYSSIVNEFIFNKYKNMNKYNQQIFDCLDEIYDLIKIINYQNFERLFNINKDY